MKLTFFLETFTIMPFANVSLYFAVFSALFVCINAVVIKANVRAHKSTTSPQSNNVFDDTNPVSTSINLFDTGDINYFLLIDVGTPSQVI
jgi:hypothetical protein